MDLIFVPSWFSHVELMWQEPRMERVLQRLSSFSRLIVFDQRGTGLSDPVALDELPTLEERMDDLRAVMDAAGSERAAVLGATMGGPLAIMFAATHPDRTSALVLFRTGARMLRADDYPFGLWEPEDVATMHRRLQDAWGRPEIRDVLGPMDPLDDRLHTWLELYQRMSMSPGAAAAIFRMNIEADVRDILPVVRVPTLVIASAEDSDPRPRTPGGGTWGSRYLAERIPGAKYIEVAGLAFLWWSLAEAEVSSEIEEFLTGHRGAPEPDRILSTVLFTDVVGSTEKAVDLGDRAWRDLLSLHTSTIRRQVERFQGKLISTAGEESLASFDGPARGIRCAVAIREALRNLGLDVRVGLHTGEIELLGEDIGGVAVHIGARVSALAGPGEVLVSSTVKDLVVGSGIEFVERGAHQLKGVPDEWRIYAVKG